MIASGLLVAYLLQAVLTYGQNFDGGVGAAACD
ncbi:hypothetical protein AAULR_19526 [Lacticaseibacillus rhamnosus MTCC 5462]|nr:hypothetical protein AAULR_19526 [Lacticaseibacillus rhamnosus MTCC 5462]